MKFESEGIVNGVIADKYGKRGKEKRFGMPILSFPFEIKDAPKGTKSYALVFEDEDSKEVSGIVWIHWLIANLHKTRVEENESEESYDFIQGQNSWHENCYGGPCPPDKPHTYRIAVYALSDNLNLRGNFSKQALEREMSSKILDSIVLKAKYSN